MSVVYFNGFDLNYAIGPISSSFSDNVSGYWDFNNHFIWSSLDFDYPLVQRTEGGQALRIGTQNSPFGAAGLRNTVSLPDNTVRLGFEFNVANPASSERSIFEIYPFGSSHRIQFTIASTGQVRVYDVPNGGWQDWQNGTLIGNVGSNLLPTLYRRLEVYLQGTSGILRIKYDGDEVINTTRPAFSNGPMNISWPQPGSFGTGWPINIDNLWVTEGEELVEGINAIQVEAAVDGYTGVYLAGFRGSLVFGDNMYQTPWQASGISSTFTPGHNHVKGKNVSNILHLLFQNNPDTGEPWNQGSGTFRWGVCYAPENRTEEIRLAGLALATLEVTDGVPGIRYTRPGNTAFFSGPWRKAQPDKTFSANINSLPRANVFLRDEAPGLYINGRGCINFADMEEEDGEPLQTIGITFAEEFRTDYRDWVRVTGTGYSFDSYFIAGYGVYGEGNRQFQNNYVTVNYRNIPTGGAYIQGLWDYSFDPDNGRWSMRQQVYHNSEGQTHGMRKLKIRGHGKALQIRVMNDGDKPFDINGWTLLITSNTAV